MGAQWEKIILAMVVSTAWMGVSATLILLNKYIYATLLFQYPMTVSLLGMTGSGLLSYFCCRVLKLIECKQELSWHVYLTKIMPVGLCTAVTLWLGNLVYLYLTVSFIQMLKAFTPVTTMLCLYLAGMETPTMSMVASVFLVAGGTAIAAYGELNLVWLGVAMVLAADTIESVRLVMIQYLMVGHNFNPIESLMIVAPASAVFLLVGALALELPSMLADPSQFVTIRNNPLPFLGTAIMGFAVNSLAFGTIKLASSLTLKVLGNVKNAVVVISGVMLFSDVVTVVQAVGYGTSIAGFVWYQHVKVQQMSTAPTASLPLELQVTRPGDTASKTEGDETDERQPLLQEQQSEGGTK